jgi:hypothetical protein
VCEKAKKNLPQNQIILTFGIQKYLSLRPLRSLR